MDGHLPFQFLPWCPDGTQPCKAASTHIETERIDIAAVRLTYEKEMPCVPDRGQDVQLVVIFIFGNFPERRAKSPLMDACHLADGIARNSNQERIVFSCSQFFQRFIVSIVVMHSVGHGCDTTAVETARVDDKFQVLAFHESDILKVQHSFGC